MDLIYTLSSYIHTSHVNPGLHNQGHPSPIAYESIPSCHQVAQDDPAGSISNVLYKTIESYACRKLKREKHCWILTLL